MRMPKGLLQVNAKQLAAAVRAALSAAGTIRVVQMFGGIGFMLNGNPIAGASKIRADYLIECG
jgi:hypothetical protein